MMKYGIFWVPDDPAINQFFAGWKDYARELEPDAPYLNHPVHCTLFLFLAPKVREDDLVNVMEDFCHKQKTIDVRFEGWHVFPKDILTGGDTVVVCLEPSASLLKLQGEVGAAFNPYRAAPLPYQNEWDGPYLKSYEQYGFPFVGAHWLPHITVASFADKREIFTGKVTQAGKLPESSSITSLSLYKIDGEKHELLRIYKFKG